jgi:hypothetical protein
MNQDMIRTFSEHREGRQPEAMPCFFGNSSPPHLPKHEALGHDPDISGRVRIFQFKFRIP